VHPPQELAIRRTLSAALVLVVATSIALPAQALPAQATPAVTHLIRTTQGSTFLGRVLQDRPDSLIFETSGGVLALPRFMIAELRSVAPGEMHGNEYWFPHPSATRLFFAPTGRMIRKGEGYYSNTYLFLNGVYGGVTDNVTIGGSVTLFPSSGQQIGYLTPKLGVYASDNLNVAVGALLGYNGFVDTGSDAQHFGLLYSVATYGSVDANGTVGIGWGYSGSGLARSPAVMLGGAARVSRRTALITENYIVSTSSHTEALLGYGVRFFGEKLSVDLAFLNSPNEMVFPGFPIV
jgi:hypothetical protein